MILVSVDQDLSLHWILVERKGWQSPKLLSPSYYRAIHIIMVVSLHEHFQAPLRPARQHLPLVVAARDPLSPNPRNNYAVIQRCLIEVADSESIETTVSGVAFSEREAGRPGRQASITTCDIRGDGETAISRGGREKGGVMEARGAIDHVRASKTISRISEISGDSDKATTQWGMLVRDREGRDGHFHG